MRVLVLSKRRYMSKDLLDDRFGRFYELPRALARRGFEVRGLCLDYRGPMRAGAPEADPGDAPRWDSVGLQPWLLPGLLEYWRIARTLLAGFRPDLIYACSDVPHLWLGRRLARAGGCRLVVDLYDNFESYPLARLPFANRVLAACVRAADGLSCVSAPLLGLVREAYGYRGPAAVIENAVEPALFHVRDRAEARRRLGLPQPAQLIGTAGALSHSRGIDTLFAAFEAYAREQPQAQLVLAGPLGRGVRLPAGERVRHLGELPQSEVPWLLSALDLAVVCNRDSAFGRYCFPQKLYEAIACGTPVLAARVGAVAALLAGHPQALYAVDDAESLLAGLRAHFAGARVLPPLPVPSWDSLGDALADLLRQIPKRRQP